MASVVMDESNGHCDYKRLPDVKLHVEGNSGLVKHSHTESGESEPGWLTVCRPQGRLLIVQEVFPPFLLAGLGMVAAGLLLGWVHRWEAFREANEMLILVPALLGLKGNLEMTLAARLSTHANLGHMDTNSQLVQIVTGNLAVVQCQAIVVGFLAAMVAVCLDLLTAGTWHAKHLTLVSSSAVTAASTASLLLASMMTLIVIMARRCGVDPDNVASPIAGMLGDFCTLGLLAIFAHSFWATKEDFLWVQHAALAFFVLLALICAKLGLKNDHTRKVLMEGWTPVIVSMCVSSLGGVILKHAVQHFSQLAAFAPVTNGAGGNLAAVQTSRLSTDLHTHGSLHSGCIPSTPSPGAINEIAAKQHQSPTESPSPLPEPEWEPLTPSGTLFALLGSRNEHARTARCLMGLSVPGAFCFVFLIVAVRSGGRALPEPLFLFLYVCAVLLQVCLLFMAAHSIVNALWRRGINPDNAAIPYVTSLGDLVGTTCLTAAFLFLTLLGGVPWVVVGEPVPVGA